jgi:hypothetical protein
VARGASRLAYHFEGAAPPEFFNRLTGPSKQYRNPIAVAQEWRRVFRPVCTTTPKPGRRRITGSRRRFARRLKGVTELGNGIVSSPSD